MIRLDRFGDAARRGWRWWTGELAACLPQRLRAAGTATSLRVGLSGNRLTVSRSGRSAMVFEWPLGDLTLGAGERDRLAKALRRRGVTLVVGADRALVCPVELPLAAERQLVSALRFEIDRRTPFPAAEVHMGYRMRERDAAGRRLRVDLVCVPRKAVRPACRALADAGGTVEGLVVELPDGRVALEYRTGAETTGRARNRIAAIGWAVGRAGMVAGLALPIFRLETLADALETEVTGLRREAGRAADLERQIAAIAGREAALDAFRPDAAPLVLLAELSRLAPDDTHITGFRFDGGSLQIDGRGASAAALATAIEASPRFRNPVFRSAVVPAADNREQFSLSFDVERSEGKE